MDGKKRQDSNADVDRIISGNDLCQHCRHPRKSITQEDQKETPKGQDNKPRSDEKEEVEWVAWWARSPNFDGGYNYEFGLDLHPKKS